jgi:hypothetical protein
MREFFRTLMQRMAALFRRRRLEDDLDEELRSHLEMAIELNLRKGMSAGVCVIATLLLGLVPAMQTGKIDLAGARRRWRQC